MMWATIRRKALSAGSSALANNGFVQSLERAQPASRGYIAGITTFEALGRGSKVVPEFHQGAPIYSKPFRDVLSSLKTDFPTQKWIRSFSSYSEPALCGEPVVQVETDKFADNGRVSFTASGGVVGGTLCGSMANAPQVANMNMSIGSAASPTFLPNLALFWHINNGIEEILADYVHHEVTRSLVLVLMRLFLIVAAKDVFVATN